MSERARAGAVAYWLSAAVLTIVGFVDLAGVGAPIFLTGVAMLVVGPWRTNPAVLWPALLGVWLLLVVCVLVAPGGCASTGVRPAVAGSPPLVRTEHVRCSNPLGIAYSGTGNYNPSLLPGFLVGLVVGTAGAYATRRTLVRRASLRSPTS